MGGRVNDSREYVSHDAKACSTVPRSHSSYAPSPRTWKTRAFADVHVSGRDALLFKSNLRRSKPPNDCRPVW